MNSDFNLADIVKKALAEADNERGRVTVLIAGRTGVGKSTLINSVFQGDFAKTGQGRPVTSMTREITKKGVPLAIWDTRGLEMESFEETRTELEDLIVARSQETDPNRHIHVAWLCIHEDGRRVEDAEILLHRTLALHMPVIGVITKARADQGFKAEVQNLLGQARNVIRVRAICETLDEGQSLKPMGLEDLVKLTMEVVPESFRVAFAAAQGVSIQLKEDVASEIIAMSAGLAAAAGASPIPFSDAFILVPIQVAMLAKISLAFGLDTSTAFLGTLISVVAGSTGATLAGRAVVTNLLKLVPGAGSLAGGVLGASTAAALTTTLGKIYASTLATVCARAGGVNASTDEISQEFRKQLGLG